MIATCYGQIYSFQLPHNKALHLTAYGGQNVSLFTITARNFSCSDVWHGRQVNLGDRSPAVMISSAICRLCWRSSARCSARRRTTNGPTEALPGGSVLLHSASAGYDSRES
jgi:hypothetical protein